MFAAVPFYELLRTVLRTHSSPSGPLFFSREVFTIMAFLCFFLFPHNISISHRQAAGSHAYIPTGTVSMCMEPRQGQGMPERGRIEHDLL